MSPLGKIDLIALIIYKNEHFLEKNGFSSGGDISRDRLLIFNQIHCDVEVVLPRKGGE